MDAFLRKTCKLSTVLSILREKKRPFLWHFRHATLPLFGHKCLEVIFFGNPLKKFIHQCQQQTPRAIPYPKKNKPVEVSIIIPVYNQWAFTKSCINSILATEKEASINYEIILADDCSIDETRYAASYYPGLNIIRTPQNMGFLRNCNHAAAFAKGKYLMLLNNDTLVLPNWLQSVHRMLEDNEQIAMAGSKMLDDNGVLQEAGAILYDDGDIHHVGKGWHRNTAIFNIPREVDYVSGCAMFIRKSFWDQVGGFDELYEEAYCEDCDLALSARQLGFSVYYQPASEVIHFRRKSYSGDVRKDHETLKKINRKRLIQKWGAVLAQRK